MKKEILVIAAGILLVFICFSGCIFSDDGSSNGTKGGALDFSLEIVRTYLESDVEGFIDRCADTLYTLEGEGPFKLKEWESELRDEDPFPCERDYTDYTMDDFHSAYDSKIYDYDEYMSEFDFMNELEIEGWSPDADDYLFWAEEKSEDEGFIWEDLLAYMVTFQSGHWELIAVSG